MGISGFAIKALLKTGWGWIIGNIKWIVIGILLVIALVIGFKVYGAFKDRDHLLEEREGRITTLVTERNQAIIERESLMDTLERQAAQVEIVRELKGDLRETQQLIRDVAREQQAVFNKPRTHTFDQLVQAKPGLIENRANKATLDRFSELEAAFND